MFQETLEQLLQTLVVQQFAGSQFEVLECRHCYDPSWHQLCDPWIFRGLLVQRIQRKLGPVEGKKLNLELKL